MGLRVKQLEWEKEPDGRWVFSEAWTSCGFGGCGYFLACEEGRWSWRTTFDDNWEGPPDGTACESLEDGKRRCQAHWESDEGIGQCLEQVVLPLDITHGLANYEQLKAENDEAFEQLRPSVIICKAEDREVCERLVSSAYGCGVEQ